MVLQTAGRFAWSGARGLRSSFDYLLLFCLTRIETGIRIALVVQIVAACQLESAHDRPQQIRCKGMSKKACPLCVMRQSLFFSTAPRRGGNDDLPLSCDSTRQRGIRS